jgi:hypothetical protein
VDWLHEFTEIHRDEDKTPVILLTVSVGVIGYMGGNNNMELT